MPWSSFGATTIPLRGASGSSVHLAGIHLGTTTTIQYQTWWDTLRHYNNNNTVHLVGNTYALKQQQYSTLGGDTLRHYNNNKTVHLVGIHLGTTTTTIQYTWW